MHQIVLVERYSDSSYFWANLQKFKNFSELSVKKILKKYQGFEGDLLLMSPCNVSQISQDKMIEEYFKADKSNLFLLHVISGDEIIFPNLKEKVSLCGYDVGVCEEEKTIYSSIFNEILFGHLPELISYKNMLNENLLFPNKSSAEKYVDFHNQLSVQGKGVEDYEKMMIYEIWKHDRFKKGKTLAQES